MPKFDCFPRDTVLVQGLQNRIGCDVCVYIFYKELSHTVMESQLDAENSCVSQQAETQQSWWYRWSLLFGGGRSFFPIQTFWLGEAHPHYGRAICFIQHSLIQISVSTKTSSKLIHKINHHSFQRSVVYCKVSFFRHSLPLLYELLTSKGA